MAKLGEMLITSGLISEQQLKEALKKQKETGGKLGSVLVELGFISEEKLIEFLSKQYKVQSVNLADMLLILHWFKLSQQKLLCSMKYSQ